MGKTGSQTGSGTSPQDICDTLGNTSLNCLLPANFSEKGDSNQAKTWKIWGLQFGREPSAFAEWSFLLEV